MSASLPPPLLQRSRGIARVAVRRSPDGRTRLADLHQAGSSKVRFPKVHGETPLTAVVINTSGGVTGGDRYDISLAAGAGTDAVATTQACEKVYRAGGPDPANIATAIRVGEGARFAWLPQETIVFEGARLDRRLDVDLAPGARFVALEAFVLGRTAMAETVTAGALRDRWRIRRDGRLVFADTFSVDDAFGRLRDGAALLAGARAFATLVLVGEDAEARLGDVRAALGNSGGASAFGGKLVARLAAADGLDLRRRLVEAVAAVEGRPAPSIWHI